jgi:hypothetical protein
MQPIVCPQNVVLQTVVPIRGSAVCGSNISPCDKWMEIGDEAEAYMRKVQSEGMGGFYTTEAVGADLCCLCQYCLLQCCTCPSALAPSLPYMPPPPCISCPTDPGYGPEHFRVRSVSDAGGAAWAQLPGGGGAGYDGESQAVP